MRVSWIAVLAALTMAACNGKEEDTGKGPGPGDGGEDDTGPTCTDGALELCNGKDDNCDGQVDEGVTLTFFADADDDGYGEAEATTEACSAPTGYVSTSSDCDDADATVNPAADEDCDEVDDDCDGDIDEGVQTTYCADEDGDGFGDTENTSDACDAPTGYLEDCSDCDDSSVDALPGGDEVCDGLDNDCDGTTDESGASDAVQWYLDYDEDGYGDASLGRRACDAPDGFVSDDTDCDDSDPDTNPAASEVCDEADNDCDGDTDEGLLVTLYRDNDRDRYGDPDSTTEDCAASTGWVTDNTDCDDADGTAYPGATETCDEVDDDCDGEVDEGAATGSRTWYGDSDGDRYGVPGDTTVACSAPSGYVSSSLDCDDADPTIYPGASEVCDGVDQDCDGTADDGATTTFYADADGDTYGTSGTTTSACSAPSGYVASGGDCDDGDPSVYPGATEACNGQDDDCDGSAGSDEVDGDGDGSLQCADCDDADATVSPGAAEACDGADQDCDGSPGADEVDADGDGYMACAECDDGEVARNPDATEACNGVDDDCDGSIDENGSNVYYRDSDGDTYGDASSSTTGCSVPSGYSENDDDCNDASSSVRPGAPEGCNGVDNDCDGSPGATEVDADGDGWLACAECDDGSSIAYPGASETCNGEDDDCDGTADDGLAYSTWYLDADGDGWGLSSDTVSDCAAPTGYTGQGGDCDDDDAGANPAGTETCDGTDEDCSGDADDGGVCPCEVTWLDTHAYQFCSTMRTWVDALSACEADGYNLATVDSSSEDAWIDSTGDSLYGDGNNWWIGFNDRDSEGTWVWADGSAVTYTNWDSGEPNGGTSESCAVLRYGSRTWVDLACADSGNVQTYVCEAP